MRDYLTAVRELLAGETVNIRGEHFSLGAAHLIGHDGGHVGPQRSEERSEGRLERNVGRTSTRRPDR
jgi:hypothetical protein